VLQGSTSSHGEEEMARGCSAVKAEGERERMGGSCTGDGRGGSLAWCWTTQAHARSAAGRAMTAVRATLERGVRERGIDRWTPLDRESETAEWAWPN
jgi:hypothetical protein